MFKRVFYEDWTLIVPIISFAVTFVIFISFFIRAALMKKEAINKLASLALEEDTPSTDEKPTQDHV